MLLHKDPEIVPNQYGTPLEGGGGSVRLFEPRWNNFKRRREIV
jgi:hypothetical protein